MLNLFTHLNAVTGSIYGLVCLLGATWLYLKKVRVGWRKLRSKVSNFYDAVAGAEAIVDPETGRILKAERFPIGGRVAVIEEWQARTITTLERISETQGQLASIDSRVTELVDVVHRHKSETEKQLSELGESEAMQRAELWRAIHKIQDE